MAVTSDHGDVDRDGYDLDEDTAGVTSKVADVARHHRMECKGLVSQKKIKLTL